MRETDTVALLAEWGKWSRGGYGNLGTRSAMAVAMELVEPAANRTAINICDEDALRVERAVARLRLRAPEQYQALNLYFVVGLGQREVALRMKISRDRASHILTAAISWVDCFFDNFCEAA